MLMFVLYLILIVRSDNMTVNEALRMIAGIMIILSLVLTQFHSPNWMWFTAFIGVNLLQSSVTKWCLMMTILKKLGLKDSNASCSD
jgi:disulfide bond formation protein DsbB